jgi:DNA-binding MarR family transcriptional regulator
MSIGQLTPNQLSIMVALYKKKSFENSPHTKLMTLDELIKNVSYDVSKASIQFSLRRLAERGFLKKSSELALVEGKRRRLWFLTLEAQNYLRRAG